MKSKNLIQIFAIFMVLLAVVGVEQCPSGGNGTKAAAYDGLSINFIENTPPASVIVNQKFQIYAEAKNLGDANVKADSAKFYLTGLSPNIQDFKTSLSNKNFLGKDATERIDFADNAFSPLELIQPTNTIMLLTSCYSYGGRAQAEVCIASSNSSQVCKTSGDKITYNTNGPVQITSMTEELTGTKLKLSFNIANKGKGVVYLSDTDCDKLQKKEVNEVLKNNKLNVRVSTVEKGLTCKLQTTDSSHNSVDALEGVADLGTIICEKSTSGEEDHGTVMQIVFDYVYVESLSRNIMISPA